VHALGALVQAGLGGLVGQQVQAEGAGEKEEEDQRRQRETK
jgi:hypothetical protein